MKNKFKNVEAQTPLFEDLGGKKRELWKSNFWSISRNEHEQ